MPTTLLSDMFSGGLNTRFRQNKIQDNQAANLRNVRFSRMGALTKRFGSNVVGVNNGSATGAVFGIHPYTLTSMSAEAMLVITQDNPGTVWRTTDGTSFSSQGTMVDLTGQNYPIRMVTFNDLVYIHGEYMDTRSYENSSLTTITATTTNWPRARYSSVFKNRVFAFVVDTGSGVQYSRLKWSDYGNADNGKWGANFEDIDAKDGAIGCGIYVE